MGLSRPTTAPEQLWTARAVPWQPRQLGLGHDQTSLQVEHQQSSAASLPKLRQEQLQREQNGACNFLQLAMPESGLC